jgi:uncharacterized protein (DUF305 family)
MSKHLTISLIIIFTLTGFFAGYYFAPNIPVNDHSKEPNTQTQFDDKEFLEMMIVHHQSAIDMSKDLLSKSSNPDLIKLANTIISDQQNEINKMFELRKEIFGDESEIDFDKHMMTYNLGDYDQFYDLRFINAMIIHHTEAVEVSKSMISNSYNNSILDLAYNIVILQNQEIQYLNNLRNEYYRI